MDHEHTAVVPLSNRFALSVCGFTEMLASMKCELCRVQLDFVAKLHAQQTTFLPHTTFTKPCFSPVYCGRLFQHLTEPGSRLN